MDKILVVATKMLDFCDRKGREGKKKLKILLASQIN
jgi:hypothetical protein